MTDALRSDRSGELHDRERDARIEALLVSGLDHYFSGQHELAINVWTRVLFLDRGHARARAYIERARVTLSEQQREGDELLHAGATAMNRGDLAAARQLVASAMDRGASGVDALALQHRLDRLEAATSPVSPIVGRRPSPERAAPPIVPGPRDRRLAWVVGGLVSGLLLAVAAGAYLWAITDPFDASIATASVPAMVEDPLPVPAACEVRLARARDLYAKGRLLDAAAELQAGDPDGRHRAGMDELRAAIQRQLLAAARATTGRGGDGDRTLPPTPAPSGR